MRSNMIDSFDFNPFVYMYDNKYEDPWHVHENLYSDLSFSSYTTPDPPDIQYHNFSDEDTSVNFEIIANNHQRPKLVEDWNAYHIMGWIIDIYNDEGFSYEPVNMHLLKNFTGSDFIKLPERRFFEIHESKAKWLYLKVRELASKSGHVEPTYGVARKIEIASSGSDCEPEPVKQKKRGRPRSLNKVRRKSEHKTGRLWEFLRDLLHNPEYCPTLICWENHDEGVFRFVCSDKVAKIWGSKRGNTEMNYEKLSRAMRYYYRNKVLLPVLGKRLVYKFGPNAHGWRTNNPNFEN